MSIISELRKRTSHAGVPLIHPSSEHVVLGNVFQFLKNASHDVVLIPWLEQVVGNPIGGTAWQFRFWERQPKPIGVVGEGCTEVDAEIESGTVLVWNEVKLDADLSRGTTAAPDRNQLIRNLDVGHARARVVGKQFFLIYITADGTEPDILKTVRHHAVQYPANPGVDPESIAACIRWSSWAWIGDAVASAYEGDRLSSAERNFALDLLAYMAMKGLWKNCLRHDERVCGDKLYRDYLCSDGVTLSPRGATHQNRYEGWRGKGWQDEAEVRKVLAGLPMKDKALLKLLADNKGAMKQGELMKKHPSLRGKTPKTLRAIKSHINTQCKQSDRAAFLSDGLGAGDDRLHEINPSLGELRTAVIEISRAFEILDDLL